MVATFTVAGLVAVALVVVAGITIMRRRRAKKFDDDVAAAAAAAYRDADGRWDDGWDEGNDKSNTSGHTGGTYGAFNEPAMSNSGHGHQNYNDMAYHAYNNAPPATNPYGAGQQEAYRMDEYPPRNLSPPPINAIPQGYGGPGPGAGVPVGAVFGAGGTYPQQQNQVQGQGYESMIRNRSPPPRAQMDPYGGAPVAGNYGMTDTIEGSRYPVPPTRSRSMNQNQNQNPRRTTSVSSSGHSNGNNGSGLTRERSPPIPNYHLPFHHEQAEEDPYDGVERESGHGHEHGYGEVEDGPRLLRVANE